MKEISACPKCKQMATSRRKKHMDILGLLYYLCIFIGNPNMVLILKSEAKLSPDLNDIVDVYRKLEEASIGSCLSEVTNLKDSSKYLFMN